MRTISLTSRPNVSIPRVLTIDHDTKDRHGTHSPVVSTDSGLHLAHQDSNTALLMSSIIGIDGVVLANTIRSQLA
jgi:hypothetical protein